MLMISLDKKIFDQNSAVAQRVIEYGKTEELYIIIPSSDKKELRLSSNVIVWSTGGNKVQQFFECIKKGKQLLQEKNITFITTQDPFFTGLAGFFIRRGTKARLEMQLHGDFYSNDYYEKTGLKNIVQHFLGKILLKKADSIRVVGKRIQKSLIENLGIDEKQIIVRPVRISVEKIKNYQPKLQLRQKYAGKKLFLFLGRFEKVKNVNFLLDVWKELVPSHPELVLFLVGDGTEREEIKKRILDAKLEKNVRMSEGWAAEPLEYIKSVNAVLFPSLSEGYGLVPLEAAAAGISVIMNDVGVANFELLPSQNVYIIPVQNRQQWIETLLKI